MIKVRKKILVDIWNLAKSGNFPTWVETYISANDMVYIRDDICFVTKPCNEFVHKIGGAFAVSSATVNGLGLIITDEFFYELPKKVQSMIVYHEVGHYVNGHYKNENEVKRSRITRTFGKVTRTESEADMYAVEMLGAKDVIAALYWCIKNTDLPFLSKVEAMKRIKNIHDLTTK